MNNTPVTTIVFADVCRSTQLFETYGDRRAREIVGHALEVMERVINSYDGAVIKTIGDEVMCTVDSPDKAVLAACEIHKQIGRDQMLGKYNIAVKIGLHFGDVLLERGDVFGDAVNVAARMVGSAKREQIIASGVTLEALSPLTDIRSRSLGRTKVRGKTELLELKEILWQEDTSNITTIARALGPEALGRVQTTVRFGDQVTTLTETTLGFTLGRDPRSDLIIDEEWISRNHAAIEFRLRSFVFVDRSTNGSYVKFGEEDAVYLHRDETPLRKHGVISLGTELVPGSRQLVYFQCKY